jgi:hypothetical protein
MRITPEFNKVARDMAEYIQHSQDIITTLQGENEGLRKQASQKVASGSPLDTDSVDNMVDHLIEAKLLKEASRQDAIDAVIADPNNLVTFVDRMATQSLEKTAAAKVRPLGRPATSDRRIQKEASAVRESDQVFENLTRSLRGRV